MGKNNRQRRAAKQRARQGSSSRSSSGNDSSWARPTDHSGSGFVPPRETSAAARAEQLLMAGANALLDGNDDLVDRAVDGLMIEQPASGPAAGAVLVRVIGSMYRGFWQPADIAHIAKVKVSSRAAALMGEVICAEAHATGAVSRAPDEWLSQLRSLGLAESAPLAGEVVDQWMFHERLHPATAFGELIKLVACLIRLPRLNELIDPPSKWGITAAPRVVVTGGDERILAKVRALLAKAESTTFPEEAEAFTAKAQELITRHALDRAVVHTAGPHGASIQLVSRRVHLDDPYIDQKATLLHVVCDANDARAIFDTTCAFSTVIGLVENVEWVELLYSSLLVQATAAMTSAGRSGSHQRGAAFRRAFLLSYATRIAERLDEAKSVAIAESSAEHGRDLLPVLASQRQAVDDAVSAMFPTLTRKRRRSVDALGWHAGRQAADQANLGATTSLADAS